MRVEGGEEGEEGRGLFAGGAGQEEEVGGRFGGHG